MTDTANLLYWGLCKDSDFCFTEGTQPNALQVPVRRSGKSRSDISLDAICYCFTLLMLDQLGFLLGTQVRSNASPTTRSTVSF
jgi:hypothetical protein